MNIKYAFSNLSRKPLFTVLTVLQLIVSIFLLYGSICYEKYFENKTEMMLKVYENKDLYSIKLNYTPELDQINKSDLENFNKFLKSSKSFSYISVENSNFYINAKADTGAFIAAFSPRTVDNENYQLVYQLNIDNNFFKKFNFKLFNGVGLKEEDFQVKEGDPIPVILGNSYSNMYKIGDTIKYLDYYNTPRFLKVKGFLEKGYYFTDNANAEGMNNLDKYIIFPRQPVLNDAKDKNSESFYKIDLINSTFSGYIDVRSKSKTDADKVIKQISEEGKLYGFDIKLNSLDDIISSFIKSSNKQVTSMRILFLIIFIFTSVGLVSSLKYSILRQFKEFGVHIMHGARLVDIAKRVLYEILILFTIANIVVLITLLIFFKNDVILHFNSLYFLINILICIALSALLSVLPAIKILTLEITDLIRRNE